MRACMSFSVFPIFDIIKLPTKQKTKDEQKVRKSNFPDHTWNWRLCNSIHLGENDWKMSRRHIALCTWTFLHPEKPKWTLKAQVPFWKAFKEHFPY